MESKSGSGDCLVEVNMLGPVLCFLDELQPHGLVFAFPRQLEQVGEVSRVELPDESENRGGDDSLLPTQSSAVRLGGRPAATSSLASDSAVSGLLCVDVV